MASQSLKLVHAELESGHSGTMMASITIRTELKNCSPENGKVTRHEFGNSHKDKMRKMEKCPLPISCITTWENGRVLAGRLSGMALSAKTEIVQMPVQQFIVERDRNIPFLIKNLTDQTFV